MVLRLSSCQVKANVSLEFPQRAQLRELSEQCAEIERVGQTGSINEAASRVIAVEASYRTTEAVLKADIERLRKQGRSDW
jgi:hypothetical protein